MIDEEITYREKGYYSTELKPKSNKEVLRVCDGCGDERWVMFCACTELCWKCAHKKLRKHNYDDHESIVRSIDEEKTYADKGYYSTDLSVKSHKEVYAICIKCGEGRWLAFGQYGDLCLKCAMEKNRKYDYDDNECIIRNIDEEKTFNEKGYRSNELSVQSHRKVYAVCVGCGDGRWLEFRAYSDFCVKCANRNEDKIANQAKKIKGNKHTDTSKKLMSAKKQGIPIDDWTRYTKYAPYCDKFNEEFKESIRERFGRVCFACPTTEKDNGRKLDVHHVNYDKECICNGKECEFVPLCIGCHSKTNGDRELWERLIINVLYYEGWID